MSPFNIYLQNHGLLLLTKLTIRSVYLLSRGARCELMPDATLDTRQSDIGLPRTKKVLALKRAEVYRDIHLLRYLDQ